MIEIVRMKNEIPVKKVCTCRVLFLLSQSYLNALVKALG